jgi:hypothetical protein
MLVLPEEHRKLFKDPFGELHQDIELVLPLITGQTIYAVGDVVTHNLQRKGIIPAVAVVDGQTMRSPCSRPPKFTGECLHVDNPPGTITEGLVQALEYAVARPPVTIVVNGEEDLAVIPLVISGNDGAILLYGQPHKGVVLRRIDTEAKAAARRLLKHFVSASA